VIPGGVDLPPPLPSRQSQSGIPLSVIRCAGITGHPLQGVSETVCVVADTPETEGCNG